MLWAAGSAPSSRSGMMTGAIIFWTPLQADEKMDERSAAEKEERSPNR